MTSKGIAVACDICGAMAVAQLPGWESVKLVSGSSIDLCPRCSAGAPLLPDTRVREVCETEIIGGPHDGHIRAARTGTLVFINGPLACVEWDPGSDHTGLLPELTDMVLVDHIEAVPR